VGRDQKLASLRLHLAEGVGPVIYWRLVEAFGGPVQAVRVGPAGWRKIEGIGPKTVEGLQAVSPEQVDQELELAGRRGVKIITAHDDDYPKPLRNIHACPPVLYVLGDIKATDVIALAVVGSRRCTHYGLEQANRFGQLLGRSGITVVSGGARGIDSAAHRGALDAGGRTIAVMGCGLGELYPAENIELFERIAAEQRGAIVSELPMRTSVLAGNFPTRNRIISGLSLGVLIVEAAKKSGSLITARQASEQGRDVFAIPGRVDSPLSQGTNDLIRDGAILVQHLDDILEHLGELGSRLTQANEQDRQAASLATPSGLDRVELAILEALSDGSANMDELIRRTEIPSAQVAAGMTMLTLKGLVAQKAGNVFHRKR